MAIAESTIVSEVRKRIDEQSGGSDYITTSIDDTIKSCIPDALMWVCLNAHPTLLVPDSSSEVSLLKSISFAGNSKITSDGATFDNKSVTLPYNYLRTIRVRHEDWRMAVSKVMPEDSDEYLMQTDTTSNATSANPMVFEINSVPQKLEIYPTANKKLELTIVVAPQTTAGASNTWNIPSKARSAFYYYLSYLALMIFNETTKANSMMLTARMLLGMSNQEK